MSQDFGLKVISNISLTQDSMVPNLPFVYPPESNSVIQVEVPEEKRGVLD